MSAKQSYLYKLFRPEFLQKLPFALSSDAFSPFGNAENHVNNRENLEATKILMKKIEDFAETLEKTPEILKMEREVTEVVHREGINVRYLGILRSHVQSPKLKQILLNEMVAR